MSGQKKKTVKELSEELEVIKEQVREIPQLKKTIVELLAVVETLKSKESGTVNNTNDVQAFNCRKCDDTFNSKKTLKKHIQELHPSRVACDSCDKVFQNNYELETHVEEHQAKKNFSCEVCNKGFYLQWRLEKHKNVHMENTKACHFFKSNRICPFEPIGCKFRHDEPSNQNMEISEVLNRHTKDDDVASEEEDEILENQCHLCMTQMNTKKDLIIHFQFHHPLFHLMMQARSQILNI